MIYFLFRKTSHLLPKKVASIIFQNENKGELFGILLWDITDYDYDPFITLVFYRN